MDEVHAELTAVCSDTVVRWDVMILSSRYPSYSAEEEWIKKAPRIMRGVALRRAPTAYIKPLKVCAFPVSTLPSPPPPPPPTTHHLLFDHHGMLSLSLFDLL
jgi:hypothetical protein